MHIKLFVSVAAIALVAGLGTASAAEQFSTLKGLPAVAMAPAELAATRGAGAGLLSTDPGVTDQVVPHNGYQGGPFLLGGLKTADPFSAAIIVVDG